MKKMVSLLCGLIVLSVSSGLVAQELQVGDAVFKKWYIQGDLGYALPSKSSYDQSLAFGARIGRMFTENISVELQYLGTRYDLTSADKFDLTTITASKIKSNIFLANTKFGMPLLTTNEKFYPYVTGGIGYSLNDWSGTAETGGNSDFSMDNSVAVKGGFGIDYYPANDIALNLEVSQLWNEASSTIRETNGTVSSGDLDIGYTSVTFGVRLHF